MVCSDLLDPGRLHRLASDCLVISAGACLAPQLPTLQVLLSWGPGTGGGTSGEEEEGKAKHGPGSVAGGAGSL